MDLYELAAYRGWRAGKGGAEKLKTVFIFADNDVVDETFLEDIQNMLNAGIVPNIYPPDELARVRDEMKTPYKQWCQK
jgi:dynein heavy chain